MTDDDKKKPSFDGPPEGSEGLDEPTGEIEEDATRQITGDALEQIRESANDEMAPEWIEKMRARKRKAEAKEREDFDTPMPDSGDRDTPSKTEAMDPDAVGSLTEGLEDDASGAGLEEQSRDGDTTEIERDATKAINRGELDTLMKEKKEEELAQEDSDATSERQAPRAGVISKTSRAKTERATREVEDEAAEATAEAMGSDEGAKKSSGLSIPRPQKKPKPKSTASQDEEGLDEDSFGDFSDEDLHAVVFGDDEEEAEAEAKPSSLPRPKKSPSAAAESSPSLDFSDIAAEDEDEQDSAAGVAEAPDIELDQEVDELVAGEEDVAPTGAPPMDSAPEVPAPETATDAPAPPADTPSAPPTDAPVDVPEDESTSEPAGDEVFPPEPAEPEPEVEEPAEPEPAEPEPEPEVEEPGVDPPGDFPDYDEAPGRPLVASLFGFLSALLWVVGGAMGMFTSLPSPWESTVPAMALGAGIVTFLLVLVGPPRKIESATLAVLGIGIGGFALVQWSNLGTFAVTDYLGMAPIVGAALAILAAIATLFRSNGSVEDI